jgi:hypothetical protein
MTEKWEYKVMPVAPEQKTQEIEKILNGLGDEGWELVSMYLTPGAYNAFVMKRPKRGGPHEGGQYAGYEN